MKKTRGAVECRHALDPLPEDGCGARFPGEPRPGNRGGCQSLLAKAKAEWQRDPDRTPI